MGVWLVVMAVSAVGVAIFVFCVRVIVGFRYMTGRLGALIMAMIVIVPM